MIAIRNLAKMEIHCNVLAPMIDSVFFVLYHKIGCILFCFSHFHFLTCLSLAFCQIRDFDLLILLDSEYHVEEFMSLLFINFFLLDFAIKSYQFPKLREEHLFDNETI